MKRTSGILASLAAAAFGAGVAFLGDWSDKKSVSPVTPNKPATTTICDSTGLPQSSVVLPFHVQGPAARTLPCPPLPKNG